MNEKLSGIVKWFNNTKGFGFIQAEEHEDVFVHFKSINGDGYKTLNKGQEVSFELQTGPKGLHADNVEKLQ